MSWLDRRADVCSAIRWYRASTAGGIGHYSIVRMGARQRGDWDSLDVLRFVHTDVNRTVQRAAGRRVWPPEGR